MARKTTVVAETQLKAKDATSPKLIRIRKNAKMAARSVLRLSAGLARLSAKTVKLSVAAGAAGVALSSIANARTREMQKLADSVGQNVETMEALGVVAGQIGLNYDNVIDLAEEMNNKLGEFAGLGEMNSAQEALEIMGLNFKDIKKLKPEKQFETIVEALLSMPDPQQASSAADMLFGGEASKFFGLMRRNGMALDDVLKQYRESSFLTNKGREGADKWGRSFRRLRTNLSTLGAQFSGVLGGAISPFVDRLGDWFEVNKDLINSNLNKWGDDLSAWLNTIDFDAIATSANNFSTSITNIGDAYTSITGGISKAVKSVRNFFGDVKRAADRFQNSATGRALTDLLDFLGNDVSHIRAAQEAYDNRQDVQGLNDDRKAGRNKYANRRQPTFFDLADDAKAHRGTGRTSVLDDGSKRHLQDFFGATASELSAQFDRIERMLQGALDVNVNVRVAGGTVETVGVRKNSLLVGDTGTNMPGYWGGR